MTTENLFKHHRQRAKGIGGEREVRKLLDDHGVEHVWHDHEAQRFGGAKADITTSLYAIEVKRYGDRSEFKYEWWRQATVAAGHHGLHPAVVYRFDRHEWRMRLMLNGLLADVAFEDWLVFARGWHEEAA